MELLYKLDHRDLVNLAVNVSDADKTAFDPFTDQQLRDYIVNKIVHRAIREWVRDGQFWTQVMKAGAK